MTKKECRKNVKELSHALCKSIEIEAMRLFDSGGVDTSEFDNNYLLPKILITAAIKNQADSYAPLSFDREYCKMVKNLCGIKEA